MYEYDEADEEEYERDEGERVCRDCGETFEVGVDFGEHHRTRLCAECRAKSFKETQAVNSTRIRSRRYAAYNKRSRSCAMYAHQRCSGRRKIDQRHSANDPENLAPCECPCHEK